MSKHFELLSRRDFFVLEESLQKKNRVTVSASKCWRSRNLVGFRFKAAINYSESESEQSQIEIGGTAPRLQAFQLRTPNHDTKQEPPIFSESAADRSARLVSIYLKAPSQMNKALGFQNWLWLNFETKGWVFIGSNLRQFGWEAADIGHAAKPLAHHLAALGVLGIKHSHCYLFLSGNHTANDHSHTYVQILKRLFEKKKNEVTLSMMIPCRSIFSPAGNSLHRVGKSRSRHLKGVLRTGNLG